MSLESDIAPTVEVARELLGRLGPAAKTAMVGARESFPLSDRDTAYLVMNGALDLFLMDQLGGGTARRYHLFRIEAGGLVFGLGADGLSSAMVLAVPGNGTQIASFPREALLASPGTAAAAAGAVAGWLAASGQSLPAEGLPTGLLTLEPGDPVSSEGEVSVAAGKDPVWLSPVPKGALFAGDLAVPEGPAPLLLSGGGWVRLPVGCTVAVGPVGEWWQITATPWADLDAWHDLMRASAAARAKNERLVEAQRVEVRADARSHELQQTIETLVRVAQRKAVVAERSASPLVAACQLIARELGITLSLPEGGIEALDRSIAPVEDIGYASRVQTQRVGLPAGWWHEDHGPLLAFHGPEMQPVALVQRKGRYQIIDPQTGAQHRVTRRAAADLSPEGFMFFRPLPDRKLGLRDLADFCLPGMMPDFMTIIAMVILTGLAAVVPPLATQFIISTTIPAGATNQALLIGGAVVGIGVAAALFQMVQGIAMLRIEGRIDQRLQPAMWDRLLKLPPAFFRSYSVGDLANRVQMIDVIRDMLTGSIISSAISSILGMFSFGLMIYYAPLLSLALAALTCVVALISFLLGRKVVSIDRSRLILGGKIQSVSFQLLGALGKLRVTATESLGFNLWAGLFRDSQILANRSSMINVLLQTVTGVFPPLALLLIILFIGLKSGQTLAYFRIPANWADIDARSINQVMPTADFMAFITAYIQFSTAVLGLIGVSVRLVVLKPMLERVRPLLETATEGDGAMQDPGLLDGHITFQNVSFRYAPDAPLVVRDVSIEVEPGDFVALVGNSGGGRSTMMRLLLGFEKPVAGQILIDGHDLSRLDKRRIRQQLGVVLQDGRLISGDIFQNICAGGHYSEDDAWEAARGAGFDKDIEALPQGIKTPMADGATTLSGGQRQRLMIARALIRKPRVLVFDEATSALDNETQEIVDATLDKMRVSRIVIAHRVTSVRKANRIYVVNDGAVVESGTWDALMERDGAFAELVKRQTL